MPFLKSFSDFIDLKDLGFTERLNNTGLLIARDGIDFTLVGNSFGPDFAVDPDECLAFGCYAKHTGEGQFSSLKIIGEKQSTIGYLFPLSSLVDGTYIQDTWPRRYAWAAVNALLSEPEKFLLGSNQPSINSLRDGYTGLDRIFPDRLAIAVLGRSTLRRLSLNVDHVRLMLMAGDLRFPRQIQSVGNSVRYDEWESSIGCPRPPQGFEKNSSFEVLIEVSDSTDSVVGAFLTLYQNFELLLSRLFEKAIDSTGPSSLTPWKLKERLSKVTSESWRFSILDRLCIEKIDRTVLSHLSTECRLFLAKCEDEPKDGTSWWQLLYAVRNILVHNQVKAVQDDYFNLADINHRLRTASLFVLLAYTDPDVNDLWVEAAS